MVREMRGITFSKQFPNPAEPVRGSFVADQVRATSDEVQWRVIAPAPYIPRLLAGPLGKPYVCGDDTIEGVPVARPRYLVLPRRLLYTTVAGSMAAASCTAFRAALNEKPDFIHAHTLYPSGGAAARLASDVDVPLVVTVHGSDLYSNLEKGAWRRELAKVIGAACALVCVSDALATDLIGLLGADPAKVTVIPDCYDDAVFRPRRSPRDEGPVRLIAVGRLVPVKGFDVLIDALASITRAGLDWRMTLVGDGPERERLVQQARRSGIAERVTFSGALSREELAAALRHSDIFVSSSRHEGFGVAIVEALGSGVPVVATRSGGPEGIIGPDDGVLCESDDPAALADAIRAAVGYLDRFSADAITSRARERFSRRRVAQQLVELYRAVMVPGTRA